MNPDQPIPTPRTDAELVTKYETVAVQFFPSKAADFVCADFARTLERENVKLEAETKRLTELNAFIAKGSFDASQVMAKESAAVRAENDQLKKRVEEAERILRLHISAIRPDEENEIFAGATNFLKQGKP